MPDSYEFLKAQSDEIKRKQRLEIEAAAVESFRQRAVAAVRALFHNSEVESARWNQAITSAVATIQQLPATTEDGE